LNKSVAQSATLVGVGARAKILGGGSYGYVEGDVPIELEIGAVDFSTVDNLTFFLEGVEV
tara:strand:+ start:1641 stop:1820 length:180 start_codon:yes stop_codon:yes gene_type:complete